MSFEVLPWATESNGEAFFASLPSAVLLCFFWSMRSFLGVICVCSLDFALSGPSAVDGYPTEIGTEFEIVSCLCKNSAPSVG